MLVMIKHKRSSQIKKLTVTAVWNQRVCYFLEEIDSADIVSSTAKSV
jgi:hypothetical protein